MEQSEKGDLGTKREMQMAALRYDLSTARPLKEIIRHELDLGIAPKWIAVRYGHLGVTVERVEKFKAALDAQAEAREQRAAASSGGM